MSKEKRPQVESFYPEQREMNSHQKKFAMSEDEAAALLPDLSEDPQKIVDRKKDEAIAHQKKVIESIKGMNVDSGRTNDPIVHVEKRLPAKAKKSIELSGDEQDRQANVEFDTQQQIEVDKKIAKAGYDTASETGGIAKSLVRRGVETLGSTMAASADLVTGTIQRGDKGAIAKDLSKMSTKHWEKQYEEVNEDKNMSEKDKANFNLRVEESNKQAALEEEARVDQKIANEEFDEASVEKKLAKQEKGGLLKRIGRWFGRN